MFRIAATPRLGLGEGWVPLKGGLGLGGESQGKARQRQGADLLAAFLSAYNKYEEQADQGGCEQ